MSAPKDPLHGKTPQVMLEYLIEQLGWVALGERININCFTSNPSVSSSLVFLRKTPWARKKVERLYLEILWPSAPKKSKELTRKKNKPTTLDAGEMPPLDIGL